MASTDDFAVLLESFERSDWQDMTIQIGADRLSVSRRANGHVAPPDPDPLAAPVIAAQVVSADRAVAAAPAAPELPEQSAPAGQPAAVEPAPATGTPVGAPSVGIFWRAPSPTEPPFVEVGARVAAGDTIGIVEVMKLMQQVPAGVAGVVSAIPVANGETVEYGQALVYIDPAG